MADLRALITQHKGDRSYEQLSRACGGTPNRTRLHQMVTVPLRSFPDPDSIRGLSRGLGVSEQAVVLACANSLGLNIATPGLASLMPPAVDALPRDAQDALLGMMRSMVRLARATPTAPHDPSVEPNVRILRRTTQPPDDAQPRVTRAARRRSDATESDPAGPSLPDR